MKTVSLSEKADCRTLDAGEIDAVCGGSLAIKPPRDVPTGTGPYAPGDPTSPNDPYHQHDIL